MIAWISLASSPPAASLLVAFAIVAGSASRPTGARTRRRSSPSSGSTCAARRPRSSREVDARDRASFAGTSLVAVDADEVEGTLRTLPAVAGVSVDRAFPHTLVVKVAPERPVAVVEREADRPGSPPGRARSSARSRPGPSAAFPRLWLARGVAVRVGGQLPAGLTPATRALAAAHGSRLGGRVKGVAHRRRRAHARPAARAARSGSGGRRMSAEARHRARRCSRLVDAARRVHRRQRPRAARRRITLKSQVEVECCRSRSPLTMRWRRPTLGAKGLRKSARSMRASA